MSVLELEDVSVKYIVGDIKNVGLKETILKKISGKYHKKEFWADRHITFSLEKGDFLGIIGTNGAGKTTLLKAISHIMVPNEGIVRLNGTVSSLIELASGFDSDLTVKENIYLRGAILGYTKEQLESSYQEILDFSELTEFEDRPFKQLSSGMKSRLAFAVASYVNPDLLILDEVLSVGDGAFRKKSEAKMKEIINGGATTILVSHLLEQIREMSNKVLWLNKGEQIVFGTNVQEICDAYSMFLKNKIIPKNEEEIKLFAQQYREQQNG